MRFGPSKVCSRGEPQFCHKVTCEDLRNDIRDSLRETLRVAAFLALRM